MKKIYLVFKLMLVLSIVIISCKKEYSPSDAADDQVKLDNNDLRNQQIRDSLRRAGGVINYSINIIDGGAAGFSSKSSKEDLKAAAVTGAKVVVEQYGKTLVVTDSANNGIVTIKDLRTGTVSVKITANGFTDCSFIASLTPTYDGVNYSSYTNYDMWNSQRYVATMVPLFPTTGTNMATVKGVVTLQTDLTNVGRETEDSIDVIGVIDVDNADFVSKYMASYQHLNSSYWDLDATPAVDYYGHIVKIAYNSIVFKGTTNAQGVYSIQVPATADGLPIRVEVSDFAINQTLLMNTVYNEALTGSRVQSIRTLFSSILGYTGNPASAIPSVPAAYCVFDAPTGTGTANKPTVEATADAAVSESGIISITTVDPGLGYTQAPKVIIKNTGTPIEQATVTATIGGADGRVTDLTIDNPGVGYDPATTTTSVSFEGSEVIQAVATPIINYGIASIAVGAQGGGYTETPPAVSVINHSGTGAGVVAQAHMKGYIYEIVVTNGGSGYTSAPQVEISGGNGDASFTCTLTGNAVTTGNFVLAAADQGSGFTGTPTVRFVGGGGSGAAANAVLHYYVESISVSNPGSGFLKNATSTDDDPIVIIAAPPAASLDPTQATATATLGFGVLARLDVANPGLGYTADPIVTITGGGVNVTVNATATASAAGGQVTGFTVTNGGRYYTSAPTVTVTTFKRTASATALGNNKAGQITSITLTGNGEGYSIAPTVEFYYTTSGSTAGNKNGTPAAATAIISGGRVTDIVITNPGSGYYTEPNIRFTMPDVNMTAKGTLTISADGYVTAIGVAAGNGGSGYTTVPTITINPSLPGVGSGAQAVVTKMDGGVVIEAKIINNGSGYVGKNNPANAEPFSIITAGLPSPTTVNSISALSGKTYVRDLYLGTGKRTIEQ